MKYSDAAGLHKGDHVNVKGSNQLFSVITIAKLGGSNMKNEKKAIAVLLDDGNWYIHRELK